MSIESDCVLWNKEEANVAGSMISEVGFGPDFSVAGAPTFPAGKFNNALLVDATTERVQLTNTPAQFNLAEGILEIWIKLTVAVINGESGGGLKPRLWTWYGDVNNNFQVSFHNTLGLVWNLTSGGVYVPFNNTDPGLDIPANTLAHMMFVWDRTGIGATANTRRVYLNSVLTGTSNSAFNDADMTAAELYMNILYNGSFLVSGPVLSDNVKWYPTVTEQAILDIAANKDNEGWPVEGGRRLLNGGIRSNLIGDSVLIH